MDYDADKVDEYALALLYLVTHERHEGLGARAWKGFGWDTLNRLREEGYISNPIGKTKSVVMTEEGFLKARELFERHFVKETSAIFPKLTPPAKKRWEQIPERIRKGILENAWCPQCQTMVTLHLREGHMSGCSLVLRGTCKKCGSEAARVLEPVDEWAIQRIPGTPYLIMALKQSWCDQVFSRKDFFSNEIFIVLLLKTTDN